LAIFLFFNTGIENQELIKQRLEEAGNSTDDPIVDWVRRDLLTAWIAREKELIIPRVFSDRLVHLLGLPNGLVLTDDILDPHQMEYLLSFYAA
jgi:hypothetical protein